EAFGSVLGFQPQFFYRKISDVFREEECNFRHRRTAPEKLKSRIRAHATLIGMVTERLRLLFKFPNYNVPDIAATTFEEMETAAEQCRQTWGLGIDAPINQIGRVLEHAGVIIVPHLVTSTKIDAFSRYSHTTSMIFLNQV